MHKNFLWFHRYLDFLFGWHMTCLNRAEKLLQAQETALGT